MGLDQGIRKMTPEIAGKLLAWQTHPVEGEEGPLTDQEYERIERLWDGRKENHIHRAIEQIKGQQVENCDYLFLDKTDVERMVELLREADADHEMAPFLLPTQDGFYFGSTEYDDYYFQDIKFELEAFTEILKDWDEDSRYAYWAWW